MEIIMPARTGPVRPRPTEIDAILDHLIVSETIHHHSQRTPAKSASRRHQMNLLRWLVKADFASTLH